MYGGGLASPVYCGYMSYPGYVATQAPATYSAPPAIIPGLDTVDTEASGGYPAPASHALPTITKHGGAKTVNTPLEVGGSKAVSSKYHPYIMGQVDRRQSTGAAKMRLAGDLLYPGLQMTGHVSSHVSQGLTGHVSQGLTGHVSQSPDLLLRYPGSPAPSYPGYPGHVSTHVSQGHVSPAPSYPGLVSLPAGLQPLVTPVYLTPPGEPGSQTWAIPSITGEAGTQGSQTWTIPTITGNPGPRPDSTDNTGQAQL